MQEYLNGIRLPLKNKGRSRAEKVFLFIYLPVILIFYALYKCPTWFGFSFSTFYFLGKSPSFWYALMYTVIVCSISGYYLLKNKNPYKTTKKKQPLSSYQRAKFSSIFFAQLLVFFVIPFIVLPLMSGRPFFQDPIKPVNLISHVYVYPAFTNWGLFIYIFIVIPIVALLFGKRYCTWFCACGNLAETVGVTPWGQQWVRHHTPRGIQAKKMEKLQAIVLIIALFYGVLLVLDAVQFIHAATLIKRLQAMQDIVIDFIFASVIGVGAYPFLGTRVWCRYGCPLAKLMQWIGRVGRFQVQPNERCTGVGLCTQACPMGIDVASYAHHDKKPIQKAFNLAMTPCIGCGGCIEICPRNALQFSPVRKK